ncbi:AAA family ATPase [Methylocella silvestris]|uniref:Response regulator receiver protein n=1 Tax=Methylocella silvestris TaxID=199596 RepID=A0A2J7TK53_METSI|nr:cellulose synthase operon protein YhjQ/BcsQ [Methylocella silvestris]PNG27145.1 response regulator receiver protein [Methylocella silvestris]
MTSSRSGTPNAKIFVSDLDSEGVIRQALDDLGVNDAEFVAGDVVTAAAALATQTSPKLLIVDISGVADPVLRIDELAERCEPDVGVVVIGDRNDIILYRNLRNAGVVEYFFKPLVRDVVKRICNNVLTGDDKRATPRTAKLIFVLGLRGGVGATTIAANAAWYLAEIRQRWVMLVDLDLYSGDAALQLDAAPSHALREAFEKPERVDKLFIERGRIHAAERLDLLASLESLGEPFAISEDAVLSLLTKLQQRYRFVFVDLPVSLAIGLNRVLHQPSACLLVSDGSLASAREVARWRVQIGANTPERRTLLIVNMSGAPGSLPEAEFIRAAGQSPDITIPYDREIAVASSLGIKATQKCASLNQGIVRLLHDLMGEPAQAPRSILSRIFG